MSPVSPNASMRVMESPSRYPAPAVPVVLSAVSSEQVSPGRDREVSSSVTLDVFPVYENYLDTSYYVPATLPVIPPFSKGLLPFLGPASLNRLLAYDITLLDSNVDLSLFMVPLLPLPDDFQLLPDTALERHPISAGCLSQLEPYSPVVPLPIDLSREGPFDAYCALSETGDHPLISKGLPGCPYRITDVAEVDPAYGLQLHHPRFLKYVGAPESAHLLTQTPGHWVQTMDREDAVAAALQLQHDAGLMTSNLQVLGQFVSDEVSLWDGSLSVGRSGCYFAGAPCTPHSPLYGLDGFVATAGWPGCSRPLPISSCNNCMKCSECFPGLSK